MAAADLHPEDIVNPVRRILRDVKFVEAEVQAIDLSARRSSFLTSRDPEKNSKFLKCRPAKA